MVERHTNHARASTGFAPGRLEPVRRPRGAVAVGEDDGRTFRRSVKCGLERSADRDNESHWFRSAPFALGLHQPDVRAIIGLQRESRGGRVFRAAPPSRCAMGSMINLAVGRLEIEWGKNNGYADHSALFQPGDLTQIPYYYAGAEKPTTTGELDWEVITEMKDGLSKPLAQVVDRINLLGHTAAVCEKEFASLAVFNEFDV